MRAITPFELRRRRQRLDEILRTLGDGTLLTEDLRLLQGILEDLHIDGQVTLVIDVPLQGPSQ